VALAVSVWLVREAFAIFLTSRNTAEVFNALVSLRDSKDIPRVWLAIATAVLCELLVALPVARLLMPKVKSSCGREVKRLCSSDLLADEAYDMCDQMFSSVFGGLAWSGVVYVLAGPQALGVALALAAARSLAAHLGVPCSLVGAGHNAWIAHVPSGLGSLLDIVGGIPGAMLWLFLVGDVAEGLLEVGDAIRVLQGYHHMARICSHCLHSISRPPLAEASGGARSLAPHTDKSSALQEPEALVLIPDASESEQPQPIAPQPAEPPSLEPPALDAAAPAVPPSAA